MSEGTKRTVYIDESGWTGSNYLDPVQPLFAVASLALRPEEAAAIRREVFGLPEFEAKYSKLRRSTKGRKKVAALLERLSHNPSAVKVWVADKRFCAWLKLVDMIVEPAFSRRGVNLLREAKTQSFATVLHRVLPSELRGPDLDALLRSGLELLRLGKQERFESFRDRLAEARESVSDDAKLVVDLLLVPLEDLGPSFFEEAVPHAVDLALAAIIQLMSAWRSATTGALEIVHDETANLIRVEDYLQAIAGFDLPEFVQESASGMKAQFPVAAEGLSFRTSESEPGLELVDVVAGFFVEFRTGRLLQNDRRLAERAPALIEGMGVHALIPPTGITPEEMGTVGLDGGPFLDYFTRLHVDGMLPELRRVDKNHKS